MFEPAQLKRLQDWRTEDILFCIARVAETARFLVGSSDFHLYEVDAAAEKLEKQPLAGDGHQSYVTGVVVAGGTAVSGSYDRHLVFWDLDEQRAVRRVPAHDAWIRSLALTPDGRSVISVADDMQCKIWDVASGDLVGTCSDHEATTPHHYPSMLYAVAVSPDGTHFATGDRVGHVAVWETATLEKVGELEAPVMYTWDPRARRHSIGGIRSLAFSPGGNRLAVGGIGKIGNIDHLGGPARLEIFDWRTSERQHELEDGKLKGLIEQIAWDADAKRILTVGGDHKGFLTWYDAQSGDLVHQTATNGHVHGCVVDPRNDRLYLACHERLEIWGPE